MILGFILGIVVIAAMTVSGNGAKIEEAYYKGFEDGKATSDNLKR